MTIPTYQDLMLPVLKYASTQDECRFGETVDALGTKLELSAGELAEMLPSGTQTTFRNRVQWATTYLKKTGLLESRGRGRFRITERGRKTLSENIERIDLRYLKQFPELDEFLGRTRPDEHGETPRISATAGNEDQSPQDQIELLVEEAQKQIEADLLKQLKEGTPEFFERLVVRVLVKMGYGGNFKDAAGAVGRSGDGGIDGIIKEDRLGLDAVYIQAKRWEGTVGRPIIQAFAGSLEGNRARKGVVITTSQYSREATDFVSMIEKKIVLIDGPQLVRYMIELGLGVQAAATYTLYDIDGDFFDS